MKVFEKYFKRNYIYSYGAIINQVYSDRSDGKSFDCKFNALKEYKEGNFISIYARRWKTEITQEFYEKYFDEVIEKYEELTPEEKEVVGFFKDDYEFRGSKRRIEIRKKGSKVWDTIVFLVPMSSSSKMKSILNSYVARIRTIDYDEFIPLDLRYIKNEMHFVMEFYKSVDRERDIVKLNFFGNRITSFNPAFDFWNIKLEISKEKIRLYQDGTVAVQIYSSKEHREVTQNTRFARAVRGTSYDNYNKGETLEKDIIKIGNINGCNYFASFKSSLGEGSIYKNGQQIVISSNKRKDGIIICDKIYNTPNREEILITYGNLPKVIKCAYKTGKLYFESESIFHMFEPLMNKVGSL